MLKKIILLLVLFINISYFCYSQHNDRKFHNIETAVTTFLTTELSLTPEESQKFFPVYKNYFEELRAARQETQNDQIALEEKVLGIRKKYKDDFKKILGSDDRVNKVFLSEKKFREILRKELMKRRMNRKEGRDQ